MIRMKQSSWFSMVNLGIGIELIYSPQQKSKLIMDKKLWKDGKWVNYNTYYITVRKSKLLKVEEIEMTEKLIKELYKDIEDAAELHLQAILELQRIQSLVYPIDDPIKRPIGVALAELEDKFHKIHDKWCED